MKLINPIHLLPRERASKGIQKNKSTGIQSEIFMHTLTVRAND